MKLVRASVVAVVLVSAAVAAVPASAWADRDGDTDAYTLVISPATVSGGSSTTFTLALSNKSSPRSLLASANLAPPSGFTLTGASLPAGTPGTVTINHGVVELRNLAVAPQATLLVTVTASVPESCGTSTGAWTSAATEQPDFTGEQLSLIASQSKITTTVTTACALEFATQPHNAIVGQHITGADFDPSGPPVTVEVVDAHGAIVSSSTAPITIALGNNPGNATLGGTRTVDAVHGVASFSDLTLDKPGNGYTLTASSPGITGATSSPFNENNTAVLCAANASCQTSITTNASVFSVTASAGPNPATLSASVNVGTPLRCKGYIPVDSNWFEFLVSTSNRGKVVGYRLKHVPLPTLVFAQFCLGAPYEFTTLFLKPAAQGTLPDGSPGFIGLLPPCLLVHSKGPCVASRTLAKDPPGFDVTLTVDIPAGLSGDPWGRS